MPAPVPAAPSNLAVTALDFNTARITFQDNSNNESSFKVERKDSGSFAVVASLGAGVVQWDDEGRRSNTTYTYRVYASNNKGNSAPTNEAGVTMPEAPFTSISVSPFSAVVHPTESRQFTATAFDAEGVILAGSVFVWSVASGSTLGTVDQTGLFTAGIETGSCAILAASQSISRTAFINIWPSTGSF